MSAHAPAVIAPASRATWRHAAADLDAEPRSVPAARHLVRLVLRSWGLENTAGTAELITAELVTNAVAASAAAGHAVIRLRLTRQARSLLRPRADRLCRRIRHSQCGADCAYDG